MNSHREIPEDERRQMRQKVQELRKRLNQIEDEIDSEFKVEDPNYEPAIKSNN